MRCSRWWPLLLLAGARGNPIAQRADAVPALASRQEGMIMWLREQIETIKQRDPAATSSLEVLLTYPGFMR